MEVKVPKEIRDYQESIFFGLSTRQFICSLLAVGVAVGLYFGLRPLVGSEEVGWICILGAAPFAACGFFKYHGMTAEQAAWAWFKSEFLYPKKLVFKSENLYYEALKDAIAEGEKPPRKRKIASLSHQLGKNSNLFIFRTERTDAYYQNASQSNEIREREIQNPEVRTGRHPHPAYLAGWDFSGRKQVLQNLFLY